MDCKSHAYELMDDQKSHAHEPMDDQKSHAYELTDQRNHACKLRMCKRRADERVLCQSVENGGVEIIPTINEIAGVKIADVKPIVRHLMDDDRILVESGTEMTPVPHEPSEFEKLKRHLTHIPFQSWCTSSVKGTARTEPQKRTERIIEDSEVPVTQCDCLMLKDVPGTSGLKVLSMYVRTFGYGMSTIADMKSPTDTFATVWAVKMLNLDFLTPFYGVVLSHRSSSGKKVSCPNDRNEQSFEVLLDGYIRVTEKLKTIRNS